MPKIPGVNHLRAIKAFEKAGFRVVRQGKHIVMSDGTHFITVPRHNRVNAITMEELLKMQALQSLVSKSCSEPMVGDIILCSRVSLTAANFRWRSGGRMPSAGRGQRPRLQAFLHETRRC
jgi:predicted RNA binding protein YcfA (HicA-like mRNA interferase family)